MPAALLTYHAYGSWLADRRQGFVERGRGIQPRSQSLGAIQRSSLQQPEMIFDRPAQRALVERFVAICQEEGYRPHAAATDPSHLHLLLSWTDPNLFITKVSARLKNLLSLHLSRAIGPVGRKWFAKGASKQRVHDRRHFDHLMAVYLPQHRGFCWSELEGPTPGGMG